MEKGPQYYISSIQERVHNTLVQYGKRSTIHKFNMEKGPQYVSWKWSQYSSIKGRKCTIVCFLNMEINQNLSLGHKPTKDTIM